MLFDAYWSLKPGLLKSLTSDFNKNQNQRY